MKTLLGSLILQSNLSFLPFIFHGLRPRGNLRKPTLQFYFTRWVTSFRLWDFKSNICQKPWQCIFLCQIGWKTFQPQTFQPQASTLDLSTPDFSTMYFPKPNFPTQDFSTPDFFILSFSTINFWTIGLKSLWLKSLGLKSPGWNILSLLA